MSELLRLVEPFFDALKAYPLVQSAIAILVVIVGLRAVRWGERDRHENHPVESHASDHLPVWLLYGPVAELIGVLRQQQVDIQMTLNVLQDTHREIAALHETLRAVARRLPPEAH